MIEVFKHGNTIIVRNPITGKDTTMVNVVFVEEGRPGADVTMSETSAFLSRITGENVGLAQLRVHTQPVPADKIDIFPIGRKLPGHINRGLYSTAQLRQQEGVDARMINGKPTYFKTWIEEVAKDDVDFRVNSDELLAADPAKFLQARTTVAEVTTVVEGSPLGTPAQNPRASE